MTKIITDNHGNSFPNSSNLKKEVGDIVTTP